MESHGVVRITGANKHRALNSVCAGAGSHLSGVSTEVTGKAAAEVKGSLLPQKLSLAPCPGTLGTCDSDMQSKFRIMMSAKARQMVPLPVKAASE